MRQNPLRQKNQITAFLKLQLISIFTGCYTVGLTMIGTFLFATTITGCFPVSSRNENWHTVLLSPDGGNLVYFLLLLRKNPEYLVSLILCMHMEEEATEFDQILEST